MIRQPTAAMNLLTDVLDAKPATPAPPQLRRDQKKIADKADKIVGKDRSADEQVRAFFDHVATELKSGSASTAMACLRKGGGDSRGKSRLLVLLCRAHGIHARLLSGLILEKDEKHGGLHYWAEAWVNGHWLPMCPTRKCFGDEAFPRPYLVLQVGDYNLVQGHGVEPALHRNYLAAQLAVSTGPQLTKLLWCADYFWARPVGPSYHFTIQAPRYPSIWYGELSPLETFWKKLSFVDLEPGEQDLMKFLLLLPLAALIVSIYRTLIGVPTFGTFGPALLGLAFLDLQALLWGLPIFVLTVLIGWGMRRIIDRFHLLLVPRTSVVLTSIVVFLMIMVGVASYFGIPATKYIRLFPLVILTHLVERFWTIEAEDGTMSSFKTLLGTIVVAVTVSIALSPEVVTTWMFNYPETIALVLAVLLLLGRYTGYRLSELYRFRDLLSEDLK